MRTSLLHQLLRFFWISICISVFIQFIYYIGTGRPSSYVFQLTPLLINFAYAFIIGIFNISFITLIQRKFSWRKEPRTLIVLGIIGTVVVSVLGFFIARVFHNVWIYGYSFSSFMDSENAFTYIMAVLIAIIVSLAFHAYYFYKFGTESELRVQKEIIEHTKAKHKALQDQLDPHFLFNSLSVLAALIEENPKRAIEYTTDLSKVYRYVLDQRQEDLVSISSEIAFAKVYLNLLCTRFEDSLEYCIDVSDTTHYTVPLSLQLLIENTVKHNKVSENKPLQIKIYNTKQHLVIQNTLNLKTMDSHRKGIGLANIKKRFELYTKNPIEIDNNSDTFTVKLPLIKPNHS